MAHALRDRWCAEHHWGAAARPLLPSGAEVSNIVNSQAPGPLVDEVVRQTGLGPAQALRAVRQVLGALDEVLVGDELTALRSSLPAGLQGAVAPRSGRPPSSAEGLFDRVQRRARVRRPVAIERTEAICRLLGATLPHDVMARWSRDLPAPVAALFLPVDPVDPATIGKAPRPPDPPARPAPRTLATGRPGSEHPVSEARPERAHRESLVRSDEPHADTKLSTSRGPTQERLHETLAEGAIGPRRAPPGPKAS